MQVGRGQTQENACSEYASDCVHLEFTALALYCQEAVE